MTTVEALKNLAVAMGCAAKADAVKGETIPEVLQFIAENYPSAS